MVAIPVNSKLIRGTISYFHGTTYNKSFVPSSLDPYYLAIAALYAAEGYIIVMSDYNGMGEDYGSMHSYVLFPIQTVSNMADILQEVKILIQTRQIRILLAFN